MIYDPVAYVRVADNPDTINSWKPITADTADLRLSGSSFRSHQHVSTVAKKWGRSLSIYTHITYGLVTRSSLID